MPNNSYNLQELGAEMLTTSQAEIQESFNRFANLYQLTKDSFIERNELTTCIFTAMIAGENVATVGLPGTGKSMIIRTIAKNILQAKYYETIVDKYTKKSDLLGEVSIPAMKEGRREIFIQDTFADCNFAFVDEFFKASGATSNAMLGVLNDKRAWDGNQYVDCPLISCVVASNEYPNAKELGALWDRFPLRYHVLPIQSEDNFERLIFQDSFDVDSPINLTDIYNVQAMVGTVGFCKGAFEVLKELRLKMIAYKIYVSDRRWKKAIKIMKAYAVLQGKSSIDRECFNILMHMMWDKPSQRTTIVNIIEDLPPMATPKQLREGQFKDRCNSLQEEWEEHKWNIKTASVRHTGGSLVERTEAFVSEVYTAIQEEGLDGLQRVLDRSSDWVVESTTLSFERDVNDLIAKLNSEKDPLKSAVEATQFTLNYYKGKREELTNSGLDSERIAGCDKLINQLQGMFGA